MDNPLDQAVFTGLVQIEKTLADDLTGERMRAMLSYFDEMAQLSEGMLAQPLQDAERQLNAHLVAGFRASQRIIRHVWETVHADSVPA